MAVIPIKAFIRQRREHFIAVDLLGDLVESGVPGKLEIGDRDILPGEGGIKPHIIKRRERHAS